MPLTPWSRTEGRPSAAASASSDGRGDGTPSSVSLLQKSNVGGVSAVTFGFQSTANRSRQYTDWLAAGTTWYGADTDSPSGGSARTSPSKAFNCPAGTSAM